jgi:hypothetical protein
MDHTASLSVVPKEIFFFFLEGLKREAPPIAKHSVAMGASIILGALT